MQIGYKPFQAHFLVKLLAQTQTTTAKVPFYFLAQIINRQYLEG
jgi:hypothetical protein